VSHLKNILWYPSVLDQIHCTFNMADNTIMMLRSCRSCGYIGHRPELVVQQNLILPAKCITAQCLGNCNLVHVRCTKSLRVIFNSAFYNVACHTQVSNICFNVLTPGLHPLTTPIRFEARCASLAYTLQPLTLHQLLLAGHFRKLVSTRH
jgi:hypothetical protein